MKKAIIDIGSNTVRLVIYQLMNNQYKQIITQKKTVGLVHYIEDKNVLLKLYANSRYCLKI